MHQKTLLHYHYRYFEVALISAKTHRSRCPRTIDPRCSLSLQIRRAWLPSAIRWHRRQETKSTTTHLRCHTQRRGTLKRRATSISPA